MTKNELGTAASPYLVQHKDNPVHWREWGPAALEEAQRQNKPILLSIGYAACHWCHVMAHESFEDRETADVMNRLFVNIKVDREERPDIDQIYMAALHALGQPGGWPLTMFLTPRGEPFWGGTYFPKTSNYGRPSFVSVLEEVERVFRESPERITTNTSALASAITGLKADREPTTIDNGMLDDFARRLYPHMDMQNGGMQGAPKFPNAGILEFFARTALRTGDERFFAPVSRTLQQIEKGGIHDHVGGGFARYSVDERWFAPHFEKMLYDNAQLLELYALMWQQEKREEFRTAAESIVEWAKRDMLVEPGCFAASQDADSENVEGKYYCWTLAELESVLGREDASTFASYYGATAEGNWREAHTGTQTNILNTLDRKQQLPQHLSVMRQKLLAERYNRIPPLRDDKILADWNGLMVGALGRAATIFNRKDWLDLAARCCHSVVESMVRSDGEFLRIGHSLRGGKMIWPGMASDYAYLARACIILSEEDAPFEPFENLPQLAGYTEIAIALAEALIEYHSDPESGLLSLPARDSNDILYRTFATADDATPNPNAVFLLVLQTLDGLTERADFRTQAEKMTTAMSANAVKNPFSHAAFLNAIDSRLNAATITVTGSRPQALLAAARDIPFLNRFILCKMAEETPRPTVSTAPAYDETAATVCIGQRCSLPLTEPHQIEETISLMRRN